MPYVRRHYCHCSAPASGYLLCDDQHSSRFVLCPECSACIPLPAPESDEAPLPLAEDQLAGVAP